MSGNFWKRMRLFGWLKDKIAQIASRLKEPMNLRAKLVILALALVIVFGSVFAAYKTYDFTQNNPKFCMGCHLMQTAYESWSTSEHKTVNCHDCHHLAIPELNSLLISFVFKRPNSVPARHKEDVIVNQKHCNQCHTEGKAKKINKSRFHARHVYMEQIECTQCHGDVKPNKSGLHHFLPTERFCTKCHKGREVHGVGMGGIACLNCHTDRTTDLKPARMKCLYCHGADEKTRKRLRAEGSLDVTHFAPNAAIINKAVKIEVNEKSRMQFFCYECHKPHTAGKMKPKTEDCLMKCHSSELMSGKHTVHLTMGMNCKDCHKPHTWVVTEASAKKDCVACHEFRSPKSFL